ncbi:META domain-containing protein [Mycolicibacter acidiphilus]|uniref:META domain-containing protein n=1 Tax=Mycolicibacter acidiphilus TaxID=2835306 RepID=UPI002022C607|nr:META domain-containing protein [Mycolicibacter acidiphilus]
MDGSTFVSVRVDGPPIPGGGPLEVGFADGKISAYAGCNRMFGPVDSADGRLTCTRLASTMMACPPPLDGADDWVTTLFAARPRWALAGDTLTLSTDTASVTLQAKPD